MARAIQALDRVLARIQALDVASVVPAAPAADAAWSPAVPVGHTPFTWTGKAAAAKQPPKGVEEKEAAAAAAVAPEVQGQYAQLEFRVGKIVEVRRHPDADALYVEKIEVGEAAPREIVSGLVRYMTEEIVLGAMVLVFANLKPSKLRGITSNGMVLCASNSDRSTVEFVVPPSGAVPGDLVVIEGVAIPDHFPEINPKKKGNAWADCAPFLQTDSAGVACFHGLALTCAGKGVCRAPSLINAPIS